ncbi:MAG: hypothetical protein ABI900_01650 [Betaproteobacteria bacterium]
MPYPNPWKQRTAAALLIAVGLAIAGTFAWQERHPSLTAPVAQTVTPSATAPASPAEAYAAIGSVDTPVDEAILDTRLRVTGWALAAEGIERVEVRLDGRPYTARYGIARPDVAAVKPGYPDSPTAGFEFTGDFANLDLARHAVTVVAIDRSGRETVLARRSLIPPPAMSLWSELLDQRPTLAHRPFRFLMMTSGVVAGGAAEVESAYQRYLSRTTGVGVAVPILYLRTTKGSAGDWEFDTDFDLTRQCGNRAVAEDNLHGVIQYAIDKQLPVQFILNGGIWADASCDTPEWDVNDHLEQDVNNCQWTQDNVVFPDDYLKNLPGSTNSPELGRTLTYNVYAGKVRAYKRRNLQAAARIIAGFAREHPDLFVGVSLDADTYMNPFVKNGNIYDYNPGMLRQFREWLAGTGPYAGKPTAGAPDLADYRRKDPLTLAQVDSISKQHWSSWDEVDPPRRFIGMDRGPLAPGQTPFWDDPWYREWDAFRKHIVALHYSELSQWTHEAGVPSDRIFSSQAFIAPDASMRPVSVRIQGSSPDYDSAGVSIEGSIPRDGHLGAIVYGPAAENAHWLDNGHSLFAAIARMDSAWAIVEMNATDLKAPMVQPYFARSYHAFRDMFNFDAQEISVMAWNGSNGLYAGQRGYLPYTAWRNTPAEDAMRDFLVTHSDLPLGARSWNFGAPGYLDDDGWRLEQGKVHVRGGRADLEFEASTATLLSPSDQVIRAATIDSLVLGLQDPTTLAAVQVFARAEPGAPWTALGKPVPAARFGRSPAGLLVPLIWPAAWRQRQAILAELKIVMAFNAGVTSSRLDRIVLYPREFSRNSSAAAADRQGAPAAMVEAR